MDAKELSEQEIKRYELRDNGQSYYSNDEMFENQWFGDWVKYEDHESTVTALRAKIASQQAKIDALMLEFCPDEMTPEQIAEWAKHQKLHHFPIMTKRHSHEHF